MRGGAQLSVTDLRRSNRHPVDTQMLAEHRSRGDIALHIVNISAHGFMTRTETGLSRGERVIIRLPHVGRIEAHLIWAVDNRAGFQFERIIRMDEFNRLIESLQPNQRLRRTR
ncbi:MAG: PilZ domain-containing protein [Sphingomonadales bacterium]|nr:PilZ domain-containing protein [Sphingomonadales bacterium]